MTSWLRVDTDEEALVDALKTDGIDGWSWATAGITILVAFIVSRILRYVVERTLRQRMDAALALLMARLAGYLVIIVGFVYSLEAVGVAIGPVLGALGIAGIALAFAFQDILENFVAGILLQLKRPFTFGDQVSINDHEGTVRTIDSRLVTIDTPAGETIMIPSATVIKADINNYTTAGERRTTVPVGVAYGTDLRRAREVLERAVRTADGVRDRPEPEVLFEGFGESSIDFVVRFWHDPSIASFWNTRSEVGFAVDAALADAGITIPYPQRTLHWAGPVDD
jgi:small-conductance mechanosensitive channel